MEIKKDTRQQNLLPVSSVINLRDSQRMTLFAPSAVGSFSANQRVSKKAEVLTG
jgi:hypothetical protein